MTDEAKPTRQDEQPDAVVEDPGLPTMPTDPDEAPRKRGRRMPEEPKADRGGKRRMDPVPKKRPRPSRKQPGDMVPRRRRSSPAQGQRYVRLRVRAEGDQLTIAGAQAVAGPVIAQEEDLAGELAFEASLADERVALGSIPDAGTLRSFPSPDGPPELQVHNLIQPASFEFSVRVPAEDLPSSALPDLTITLYRIKGTPPDRVKGPAPLAEQLQGTVRPIARLQGISLEALDDDVRAEVERALG